MLILFYHFSSDCQVWQELRATMEITFNWCKLWHSEPPHKCTILSLSYFEAFRHYMFILEILLWPATLRRYQRWICRCGRRRDEDSPSQVLKTTNWKESQVGQLTQPQMVNCNNQNSEEHLMMSVPTTAPLQLLMSTLSLRREETRD